MIINIKSYLKIIHTKIRVTESIKTEQISWSHQLLTQIIISVGTVVIKYSGAEPAASQLDMKLRWCSFQVKTCCRLQKACRKNQMNY